MNAAEPVTVVIAAYNEAAVIARVVGELVRAGYPVVVVDDGSRDDTAALARAAGAVVIAHPFNLGQGAALQTGIDYALAQGAQVIVTFDADGQHRIADIARLVGALAAEQADFALGSRFLGRSPNLPALRRLLLRAQPVHPADHRSRAHRYAQRPARHDSPRRRRAAAAAEPDGARLGADRIRSPQRAALCRACP